MRFGVIVLFFGVAFLLKYASEHIEISIEARLIGVALGAVVMLGVGWRLRSRRPGYALIIQGGGIGLLYLTVFAAFRLYQLLPGGLVFALLAAMAVFSAMLAVLQDSRSLGGAGGERRFSRAALGIHRRRQPRRICLVSTRCSISAFSSSPGSNPGVR